jgi:hypothetical protein
MNIVDWINTTCSVNWSAWGAIGACAASALSLLTLFYLKQQLKLEQEPFIVARDDISLCDKSDYYYLKLKNVGRGPAFNITGCKTSNEKYRNKAFFSADQPHSKNLCANNADSDTEKRWKIDKHLVDSLETEERAYKAFYLFYESQLGDVYYSRVKIKSEKDNRKYVVMDNKRVRLRKVFWRVFQPRYFLTNLVKSR